MAIKGKSKSKTGKAVTRGPKPAYVPVKRPVLARRGFWIGTAVVLGVLLLVGLTAGFIAQRNSDREEALKAKMASAVTAYQDQLAPILAAVGQEVPPTGFESFPALGAAIQQMQDETGDAPVDPAEIVKTADDAREAANSALDALNALDEQALVQGQGFPEAFVLNIIDSKGDFVRSMKLYVQAAELTKAAAEAQGPERVALLARARGVADVAAELASRANSQFIEAQVKAEVFEAAPPPAGLPIPTGP